MKRFLRTKFSFLNVTRSVQLGLLMLLLLGTTVASYAAVTITAATGGTNIKADSAANSTTTPGWRTLGDIVILEGQNGDFTGNLTNATFALSAPTGWAFNAGVGTIAFTSSRDMTGVTISVTSSTITVTYSTNNPSNKIDQLTISGIQVKASFGLLTSSPSGNIVFSSASTAIVGVTTGTTSAGSLSQTYGAASKLSFTTQPGDGTSNSNLTTQPVVTVQDQFGNTVTNATNSVTLAIGTNPNSGVLSATTNPLSATSGVASFAGVKISTTGTGYTLTAAASGLTGATSSSFNITGISAVQTTLTPTSASITANGTSTQVLTVQAKDAGGSNITTGGATVAITKSSGTGTIGSVTDNANGTYTATVTSPTSTGSGVFVATINGSNVQSGGGSQTQSTITYTAGALDHFAISSISSPQTAGTAITGITFTAQDVNNNTVTSFTGTVTYSGTAGFTGTSGAFTSGQLTGVSLTPTLAGSNLTLIITGTAKTGTATFTVNPGALDHFAISSISSPQTAGTAITGITLTAQDANNNTQTSFTGTVTYGGTAGITGTSGTFSSGVLTSVSVTPTTSGTSKTFTVTKTSSTETGSTSFDVNPGAINNFLLTLASPQTNGSTFTGTNTLTARDANNNTVTSFDASTNNVTISVNTLSGSISGLSGVNKLNSNTDFVSGVANLTSLGLKYSGTAGTGTFTATTATGSYTGTSGSVTINNPSPTITSISPTTVCVGGSAFTITVNGTNFNSSSIVKIGGTSRTTTYVNSTKLTAAILAGDITSVGSPSITVFNPTPGGGTSSGVSLTVGQVVITPTLTQPTCYSAGAISLSISGGTAPYTYDWADVSGTANAKDRTGLDAGSYTVTVTDANGCSTTSSTLTLNAATSCNGLTVCKSDNASKLSVTPDPNNSTYTWSIAATPSNTDYTSIISAGQGTPTATINWTTAPVGAYTVTVVASNASCGNATAQTRLVYVTTPTIAVTADAVCVGSTLNLYASGGSTYSWTGPNSFTSQSSNPLIYNVSTSNNGYYVATVTDANGCSKTDSVSVSANAVPTLSLSSNTSASCGASTGAVSITTNATSYQWSNGATSQNITSVPSGNYTVVVTNASGCTATATYAVQNSNGPSSSISSTTNVSCNGGSNGAINLSVSGGTSPYSYAWTGPSNYTSTSQNLTGLAAGSYSVTVTDNTGCTTTASATITQPNTLQADGVTVNNSCFGNTAGSVTLTVSGGTPTYSYAWTGPSSFTASTQNISGRGAGTYTVTISDTKSCSLTQNYTITQPTAALTATPTITNVSCNGSSDGQVTLAVSGGTSPYTYAWSGPSSFTATTKDISGRIAGDYTVTITDAKSCTFSLTAGTKVTITQPNVLSASITKSNVTCSGLTDGTITVSSPAGGYGTYQYQLGSGNWQSSGSFTALDSATYTVKVRDAAQTTCFISLTSQTITKPAVLNATVGKTDITCNNANNGIITISSPTGGLGTYEYRLNTGSWQSGLSFTGLASGSYSVQIRDAVNTSCVVTLGTQTISNPAALNINASVTNILCNAATTGAINITVTGGTGAYSYNWNSGASTAEDRTGLAAGSYSVTVTDINSCTASASYTITQPTALSLSSTKTDISCNAGSDGSIALSVSGGTSPYTYVWKNVALTTIATTKDVSGLTDDTYTVTVTDANGCTATNSKTITRPSAISRTATPSNVTCSGGTNGSISLSVSGGTASYSYIWSNGSTSQNPSSLSAGTYNVTITDSKGCTSTTSATITEPSALVVSVDVTNVKCFGGSTGKINLFPSGGVAPYTYLWSTGATVDSIYGKTTGTYSVTVTDFNGCVKSLSSLTIGTASLLTVNVDANDRNCITANGSATSQVSGGVAPYTYLWSPGSATTSAIASLTTGTYSVTVTDANGCTANNNATVGSPTCTAPTAVNDNFSTAYNTQIVDATVATNDSDPAYTVLSYTLLTSPLVSQGVVNWNSSNNGTFTFTPANGYTGTFTFTYRLTNPLGLTSDATVTITVFALPTTATNTSGQSCISVSAGAKTLGGNTPTVGTGAWSIISGPSTLTSQFSSLTNPTATFTPAGGVGNYLLRWTISNAPSPSSSADATITVNPVSVGGTVSGGSVNYCSTTNSTTLTLSGNTGSIQWQSSTTSATSGFSDISSATESTYTANNIATKTYFRAVVTSGNCTSANSSVDSIMITAPSVGGTVSGGATVCSGTNSTKLTLAGKTGTVVKWQSATTGDFTSGLVDISNTTDSLIATNLTTTTYYRAVVASGACSSANSTSDTVKVNTTPSAPTSGVDGTRTGAGTVDISASVPGGITIDWYAASTGGTVLSGGSGTTLFTTPSISTTTIYYAQARNTTTGCISSSRLPVTANVTGSPFNAGAIASNQLICSGTTPNSLTSTTAATGGSGTISYQWQSSTTSTTLGFSNIVSATSATYAPGALTQTTYFRRVGTTTGSDADTTSAVTITVQAALANNTATSSQTICSGSTPNALTGSTPTGGNGTTYAYQWQSSTTAAAGSWTNIVSAGTSQGYTPGALSTTTYYRRYISSGACSVADTSSSITITVQPALANNTISSSQTICSGSTPNALTGSTPTGGSGTYTYQWQKSTTGNAGTWTDTVSTKDFAPGSLTTTTYYRRYISSGACSVADTSSNITITVQPALASNTISASQTICSGSTPNALTGSTPTGGNGTYAYQWQSSTTAAAGSWTNIVSAGTSQGYTPGALSATTYYRRYISSGACSVADTSASITITVQPALASNTISASQTICSSSTPTALTGSTPTGGNGTYTYQWQSSTTAAAGSWSNVVTTQNFSPSSLTTTTYYRRYISSGACSVADTSSNITITVQPALASNTISASQTICSGSTPNALTGSTPTGGNGTYTYQWQSSTTAAAGSWTNIVSAGTSQGYTPGALSATTYYRRYISSGACSVADTSSSITITVQPALANNTISSSQTICSGSTPNALTGSTPTGGSGTYAYQWQSSTTGAAGSWTNGVTTQNFSPSSLTTTTYYRRYISSGACSVADTSASITITVQPALASNTISADQTICSGSTPTALTGSTPTGGNGTYAYQWQSSTTGAAGSWSNGVTTQGFSPSSLTTTSYYRRYISSGACSVADTSSSITITVQPALANNTISSSQTICSGSTPNALTGSTPTGGNGTYTYQWQSSTTAAAGSWSNVVTTQNFSPSSLTTTTYYRRYISSGACSVADTSSNITITVQPALASNTISASQTICSGSTPNALTGSTPTGGNGTYAYQWQSSTTGAAGSWSNGVTTQGFSPSSLTTTTYYRRYISSGACSVADTSASITITVQPALANNTISSSQTICSGSTPNALTGSTPTGGSGTYTYQWQSSTTGAAGSWSNGVTAQNFSPSSLTTTTYYRRYISSGSCSVADTSASVTITVNPIPSITLGSINNISSSATSFDIPYSATTGGANQYSVTTVAPNVMSGFSNIGFTSLPVSPITITIPSSADGSYTFVVKVKNSSSGCISAGDTITLVISNLNAGSITANQTICSGTSAATLTSTAAATGAGTLTYFWQKSTVSSVSGYSTISSTNSLTYSPGTLTQTTWYRRAVTNGTDSSYTSSVKITVDSLVANNTISSSQTICTGSTPSALTGSTPTGGNGTFAYQWQSSTTAAAGSWSNVATTQGLSLSSLTTTTYYRRYVASGVCNVTDTSAIDTITVNSLPTGGTVTQSGVPRGVVCTGTNSSLLTLSSYSGTIQWQSSLNNSTWTNITDSISSSIRPANVTVKTYYRALVSNGACSAVASTVDSIQVNPTSVGGNVTGGGVTVCSGSNSTLLTLAGNTGSIQWYSSSDNISFIGISGANSSTYTGTNITSKKYYKAQVTSGVCPAAFSNVDSIMINPVSVGGTVSGNHDTVCISSNSTILSLTGNTGTIQWQSSTTSATTGFTNISSATSTTYTATNLTVKTYFRAIVTSGVCASDSSSVDSVLISPASNGSIVSDGGVAEGDAIVCSGTNSTTLAITGVTGTIQWQSSIISATTGFSDIAGATGTSYTATNLTQKTYYRVVATSGVCPANAGSADSIRVNTPSVGGTAAGTNDTVCTGTNSTKFILTGYTGSIQWQSSTNPTLSGYSNISGATSDTLTVTNVSTKTYYRAVVTNGVCPSTNSNSDSLMISPLSVGGTVSGSNDTVCTGTNSTTMTLSGSVGTIQWQASTVSATTGFADISGANSTTYTASNLTVKTYYRAVVTSGVCSATNSSVDSVMISPTSVAGTFTSSNDTVCTGSNSTLFTLSGYTGNIQWQSSLNPILGGFSNINGATSSTYTATNLTTKTYYRAVVTSGVCAAANTAMDSIMISPLSVGGTVSGSNDTVCTGTNSTVMTLSGSTGTIQWQASTASATTGFTNISGATSTTYTASNLTVKTYYRAVVTSGVCSATNSSVDSVMISPTSVAGTIGGGHVTVCSGTNSTLLTLSGYTGNIQWQSSTNPILLGFTNINGATSDTYTAINLATKTYYRAVVTSGACAAANTAIDSIMMNSVIVSNTISANDSVCDGSIASTIIGSTPTGGNGTSYTYLWLASTSSATTGFTAASGTNNTKNYVPGILAQTTWFKRIVTSGACANDTSSVMNIKVNALPSAPTSGVDGSRTGPGTVNISASVPGGITIDWYASATGGSVLSGGSGTTNFTTPSISTTSIYYAEARNATTGCVSSSRIPVSAIINGTFSPGAIGSNQTICTGATPAGLTSTVAATGGTGTISYQWQSSTSSTTTGFSNIASATSAAYAPGPLTQTTYFRRVASTPNPDGDTTNVVTVTVNLKIAYIVVSLASTNSGTAPVLPSTVTVKYVDSTSEVRPFTWDTTGYSGIVGTYQFNGSLNLRAGTCNSGNAVGTLSLTVNADIKPIIDKGTIPATGGVAISNVLTNDSTNGSPSSFTNSTISQSGTWPTGITLNTSTGAISVANGTTPGVYVVTYQLCDKLTPIDCVTKNDSVTVTPVINPTIDKGTVAATGGVAISNVLANDSTNGIPSTFTNSTISQSGTWPTGITLNTSTGAISVANGTTPGVYVVTYQLCDKLTPANCATKNDSVTVTPVINPTIDKGTVAATGGVAISNVLANDSTNGIPSTTSNSTISQSGTWPTGITLNTSTGAISVANGTTPGVYVVTYQLCDKLTPANCATKNDSVTVTPVINPTIDKGTVAATGGVAISNVLTNDSTNGIPSTFANSTIAQSGTWPTGITLNTSTGAISVANGTTPGVYVVTYQLCDKLTPANCATKNDSVTITPVIKPTIDKGTVAATGGIAISNVLANDSTNGIPSTTSNSTISQSGTWPTGITLNTSTGAISVANGTTPGVYVITYQLCDKLTPANCATKNDSVTVTPVINPTIDKGTVAATGGVAISNVLVNDSTNGIPSTFTNSTISQSGTWPTGITLNTSTGAISVANGTTPGVYVVTYQLCDKLTPANCATKNDSVTVTPVIKPVTEKGSITSAGGIALTNILSNDSTNGLPSTLSNSTISQSGTWPTGITLNTSTGGISVAFGTAIGVYPITYQLCDKLTPANCATIKDTVVVTARLINLTVSKTSPAVFVAAGDSVSYSIKVTNNGTATLVSGEILTIIEQPAVGLTIGSYSTTNGTYNSTTNALTLNSNFAPTQFITLTVKGRVALPYTLDSIANSVLVKVPGDVVNSGDSTSTVKVDVRSMIDAINDDFTNDSTDGAKGGVAGNVLTNDILNGSLITNPTKVTISLLNNGGLTGVTINAAGNVIVPAGTFEGSYTLTYRICDSTNCDSATVLIKIKRGLAITTFSKCVNDVPYVHYKVTPNFNPNGTTPVTITWLNGDGTLVTALPSSSNNPLETDILYAGTKPDINGNPTSWPGWCETNGVWRQCNDGFLGVRPSAKLVISVNPKDTITVSYPPATPACSSLPPAISKMAVRKRVTSIGNYNNIGDTISYAIVVENTGNVNLSNIQVIDSNATFVAPTTGLIASLNVGDSSIVTARHILTLADMLAKVVKNTAYTTGKDTGNVVINGKSDSVISYVGRNINLGVSKTKSTVGTSILAGDSVTYTITVSNNGVSSLNTGEIITIIDQPAAGLTIGSYNTTNGSYNSTTGALTLNNSFAQGQSVSLNITARIAATFSGDSIANSVLVKLPGDVLNTGDSTDTVYVSTNRIIDLSVLKIADKTLSHPLDTITYTIVVKNKGTGVLFKNEAITIHEYVPDSFNNITYTAVAPIGSSYTPTSGLFVLGDSLSQGDSVVLKVKGIIDSAYAKATITNCVKVKLPNGVVDSNAVNDSTWIIIPIKQFATPQEFSAPSVKACKGNPVHLTATSTGIINPIVTWYSDSLLTHTLSHATIIDTLILNSTVLYATVRGDNKAENTSANAIRVNVIVHDYASDTMIITNDTIVCYGKPATLIAKPAGPITEPVFTWYALPALKVPIAVGDTFNTTGLTTDTVFYVTIKGSNLCESRELHLVKVKINRECGSPRLGLAKALSKSVLKSDGSYDLTFNFAAGNYGDEDIINVKLKDDLAPVFPNATIKVISLTTTSNWIINTNYDGLSDVEMLAGNSNGLAVGTRKSLTLTVNLKFAPNDTSTTYKNVAEIRGTSNVNGKKLDRKSQDGTDPDPSRSGTDSNYVPTPIVIKKNVVPIETAIFIPDGFTPNGDNAHDYFIIDNPQGFSIYLAVYNRWGNMVYEKDNYDNSWDGRSTKGIVFGEGVPDGTYFYVVEYTDADGKRHKLAHSLTISR